MTPAQKRRWQAKLRAVLSAEVERDAYGLELNEAGVSLQALEDASGEKGTDTHAPRPTVHRWIQRARTTRDTLTGRLESETLEI